MTQWVITKDYIADRACAAINVQVLGPRAATMTAEQIENHPQALPFRLYDDDGGLYYEGVLVGNDWLAPLDDYGTPNAGCTYVKVLFQGTWVTV